MLEPTDPSRPRSVSARRRLEQGRPALVPPPPLAMRPSPELADPDAEAARLEALRDLEALARLIRELEQWRRRQLERPASPRRPERWVFVRDGSDMTVRIRFEHGRPVELRTSGDDPARALAGASHALGLPLFAVGAWRRDGRTLDWVASVRVDR